jgi:DNA-binding transcriptional MerR regulator
MATKLCLKSKAMEGFTRQETLALAKATSGRLAYLDRTGLIVPEKYGNPKKPTVIYSWEQLLEIIAIKALRQKVSLQVVRRIIQFLDERGFDPSLRDKRLVAIDEEVFWVMPDWSDMLRVMKIADKKGGNKDLGQFVLVVLPSLSDIISEVWKAAHSCNIVNIDSFKRRAKVKPSEIA